MAQNRLCRRPRAWTALAALLASGLALGCARGPAGASGERRGSARVTLVVSAAISLADPLGEIQKLYEQRSPGVKITCNFGSSGILQYQIKEGAPVDVFFSAAEKQMDDLDSKGFLVPGTRKDLLTNSLVLVAPRDSVLPAGFADLALPHVKVVAMGEPESVPAGMYARQLLDRLGLRATVEKKAVFAKDVHQVLTYVETGDADAGIVYRTDAQASRRVRIVAAAPAGSYGPVVYPAAVVKNSKDPAAARAFVDFLSAPEAQAVFRKYGFGAAGK